jgi:hypothetical protein
MHASNGLPTSCVKCAVTVYVDVLEKHTSPKRKEEIGFGIKHNTLRWILGFYLGTIFFTYKLRTLMSRSRTSTYIEIELQPACQARSTQKLGKARLSISSRALSREVECEAISLWPCTATTNGETEAPYRRLAAAARNAQDETQPA